MGIAGFHVIGTTYGFWLPNAESGSGSDFVRAPHLTQFGPANPVSEQRSVAKKPFDPTVRALAQSELMYPPVKFTDAQIQAVGHGFADEVHQFGGTIWPCAILPTHFHLVIGPHRYDIRRFAGRLRGAATKRLRAEGLHPLQVYEKEDGTIPSPWGRLPWVIYLWDESDIFRSIEYARSNLERARMPRQEWAFVREYRGRA